jgi:hypothetical protein
VLKLYEKGDTTSTSSRKTVEVKTKGGNNINEKIIGQ